MTTKTKATAGAGARKERLRAAMLRAVEEIVDALVGDLDEVEQAPAEVSSLRLPPDAKNADAFNRACKRGRVKDARKLGRVWVCSRAAWDARTPAQRPAISADSEARSREKRAKPLPLREGPAAAVSDGLLAELGRKRRAG